MPSQRGHVTCNSHPSDRARERPRSFRPAPRSRTSAASSRIAAARRISPLSGGRSFLPAALCSSPLTARARRAPTGFQRLLALRGRRPGQHPTSAGQEAPTLSSPAPGECQPPSASAPSQRPPPSAGANYRRLRLSGVGSQELATPTPS